MSRIFARVDFKLLEITRDNCSFGNGKPILLLIKYVIDNQSPTYSLRTYSVRRILALESPSGRPIDRSLELFDRHAQLFTTQFSLVRAV